MSRVHPAIALLVSLGTFSPAVAADPPVVHRTANFVVSAPTEEAARAVADEAERVRRQIALRWAGREQPAWPKPCVIRLALAPGPSGGSTELDYAADKPGVTLAEVYLQGDLKQLLAGPLPHELAHVYLAHHFGKPVPRWADEGFALLAEADPLQTAHDARCRDLLNEGRGLRLRVLFRMMDYPRDLMAVYTQGHSAARFLLARKPIWEPDPKPADEALVRSLAWLEFVRRGMDGNTGESWDRAAKEVYGFDSTDAVEEAWIEWLKKPDSVLAAKAADRSVRPVAREVPADMIPPIELPGSGQPPPDR